VLISSKFKGARAGGPWTWFYGREDEATCTQLGHDGEFEYSSV
jgi:hypothetical protein